MKKSLAAAFVLIAFAIAACAPVAPLPGMPTGECSAKGDHEPRCMSSPQR